MRLKTALNEYKRDRGHGARFPEERQTVTGAFSGYGDRLVYVSPTGSIRDYSASLSGLYGIDRSRLGIETVDDTYWFADLNTVRQHYYRETRLVETEYDAGDFTVHQYDLTLGRAHVTHVELRGSIPAEAHLVAFLTHAPEGRETSVGRLIHEHGGPDGTKAVEVYHRREHDYVTASTGLDSARGLISERFPEILSDEAIQFPREAEYHQYEDTHLSGDLVVTAPLERAGRGSRTTLVSQLSDHEEVDRETALADLRTCATSHESADALRTAARERASQSVAEDAPRSSLVRADLRALDLLEASSGVHIAGPEFDPFYAHSGGYGYTWFRDDAEVSRHLLDSSDYLDLEVTDRVKQSAEFYCDNQLPDGTWPHRVWADSGDIAPGWANAALEGNEDSPDRQSDQNASVTAFLATLLSERGEALPETLVTEIGETISDAVDAMDETLTESGLPEACQNAWEDMIGQFGHTAATYLEAYSAVARAPVSELLRKQARTSAQRVYEGLDELWDDEREIYALRRTEDGLDSRLDSATLALVDAYQEYAAIEGKQLTETDLDRLTDHVGAVLNGLFRNPQHSPVAGLIRYEGDFWRSADQTEEKIWTVSTASGAIAAAKLGVLLNGHGRNGQAFLERAGNMYELLEDDGPLTTDAGYLAEQVFDDGTHDSAAPLGWSHAIRLETTAILDEQDALPSAARTPEAPTERPRWTTGEKYGIGTMADHGSEAPSRVWFTLTQGALTEARFPRIDVMNLRTLDFLVRCRDETGYTVRTHTERGREAEGDTVERRVEPVVDDALLYRHVITETGDGRGHEWTLTVEYATDSDHDAIVADVQFEAADGEEYDIFGVTDAALTNSGVGDRGIRLGEEGKHHLVARDPDAYTGEGDNPLLADQDGNKYSVAIAMASQSRFDWATVGTAGSEHLQALFTDGELEASRETVDNDNVVLVGRLGSGETTEETLALGFARNADTAAALGEATGALAHGYEVSREAYVDSWQAYLEDKSLPTSVADDPELATQYHFALMTLMAVEDKTYFGASIASPSVPWGEAVTAHEAKSYGYNFVWSRDLYQVFTVFEMVDELETAVNQLSYIYEYQQNDEGFIPQNTYINGITRWGGEQMDNISYPQVMAYQLAERGFAFDDVPYSYENVRASADYVARNGPATAQERWEEESGYSPSSIAAEIAGLVCAGSLAVEEGKDADALIWLALADHWTNNVERWTATETGTDRHTQTPYYTRVTRDGNPEAGHLRTLANAGPTLDEREIIDAGFLDLVRLGIKPWDDPVMRNSVDVVDDTIRVDLPAGPGYYRYNGDGYGERERGDEGAPWSVENHGKGRLWPLLTGERGEYELFAANGDGPSPTDCLSMMQGVANSGRMISEQVWDREHGTDYNWEFGEGTGAATPLAWSMAQYVRLAHGISAGEPVETPKVVRERYLERGIHNQDSSPALRVDSRFQGDRLIVSGETTGEVVAVKTPTELELVEPTEDGDFECDISIEWGENQVIVAAASDRDLTKAATTVSRFTL